MEEYMKRQNKLTPAEQRFAELLAEAVESNQLDFYKKLDKIPVPPAETFMIGKPIRPWWRRWLNRIRLYWIWPKNQK